ncbi:hypothetical protein QJS10_CPA07g00162 [Acorus calamus]|uniref:Uncharacterized protein n=1 Tax=Acorus calamus TaxID=4465 RepID=A0AAV9EFX6_ACOCL|nr:hypothetical protein QJS10_CPA07g00162 [Acorus calamus]
MAPPYPFPSQVKLVTACCIIHNHIRREHRNDWLFTMHEQGSVDTGEVRNGGVFEDVGIDAGSILRDSIAEQMWSDILGE